MELESNQVFIILIFIILVYVIYTFWDPTNKLITSMLVVLGGAFMALLYYGTRDSTRDATRDASSKSEHIVTGDEWREQDRRLHTRYDNISQTYDSGPVTQIVKDVTNPATLIDPLDNSDIVEKVVSTGASTHVPLESQSDDFFELHDRVFKQSGDISKYPEYRIPINERAINVDDKLSRKQHHRAQINERSITGAVRKTRNYFDRFFKDELDQTEQFEWWGSNDNDDDKDTDYKYF